MQGCIRERLKRAERTKKLFVEEYGTRRKVLVIKNKLN